MRLTQALRVSRLGPSSGLGCAGRACGWEESEQDSGTEGRTAEDSAHLAGGQGAKASQRRAVW